MSLKEIKQILLALGVVMCSAQAANAQKELKFATLLPPTHIYTESLFAPVAKALNEAAGNELKVQIYPPPFATMGNSWERVNQGIVDISAQLLSAAPVPMPKADVVALPNLTQSSEAASVAMWRLYEQGLLDQALSRNVIVLGFFVPSANLLFTKSPVTSLDDFKGLRLRVASPVSARIIEALGGSPISLPSTEIYQALDRGVAEGLLFHSEALHSFHLDKLVDNQLQGQTFGMAPLAILMNRKSYESLNDKARAAVDSVKGEDLSRRLGKIFDGIESEHQRKFAEVEGNAVNTINPADLGNFNARMQQVIDQWVAQTDGGADVLAAFKREVDTAGKSN
ncbi:MAG: TRAP transporter substrate-binding protein [Pigmentiphaga sp.]